MSMDTNMYFPALNHSALSYASYTRTEQGCDPRCATAKISLDIPTCSSESGNAHMLPVIFISELSRWPVTAPDRGDEWRHRRDCPVLSCRPLIFLTPTSKYFLSRCMPLGLGKRQIGWHPSPFGAEVNPPSGDSFAK